MSYNYTYEVKLEIENVLTKSLNFADVDCGGEDDIESFTKPMAILELAKAYIDLTEEEIEEVEYCINNTNTPVLIKIYYVNCGESLKIEEFNIND